MDVIFFVGLDFLLMTEQDAEVWGLLSTYQNLLCWYPRGPCGGQIAN
jgi:hypothetical protein